MGLEQYKIQVGHQGAAGGRSWERESSEGLLGAMGGKMSKRGFSLRLGSGKSSALAGTCTGHTRHHSTNQKALLTTAAAVVLSQASPVGNTLTVFCAYAVKTPLPPLGTRTQIWDCFYPKLLESL